MLNLPQLFFNANEEISRSVAIGWIAEVINLLYGYKKTKVPLMVLPKMW